MVYEFAVYSDGRMALEYVSSGCEEVFGFSAQKLTDGSLPLGALIVDEEREGFIRSIQAAVAEVSPWRWEGRAHIATGGLGWIRGESQPARRADGVMVWYGVVTNVTAAHEAQRSLEEARLFLGAVIDQMPDIVFLKDADTGRYVLFNEAGERFFGLERGQAIGQDATLLFGPEIGETINARDQLIAGGSMMNVHEIPCVSHGAPKLLLSRKLPIRAPGTDHPYLIGIATDITDAKVRERELVASNASLEERVRERTRELHTSQVEILDRLGRAAGFRDDDTGAHIHRMSRYCAAIAKEAGLDAETCELIEHAAPMHDIGKIAVPDAVLLKPGRLDDEEMAAMRLHAEIGAQMLAGGSAALIRTAEEIARTHHERWDGTGYPLGLAGPEIPLVGRISAIADVFDALTSERPYKRAWTVERAAEEIRRGAGGHFDPDLVAAFERALATIVKIQEGTIAASQIPISRAA